MLASFPNQMKHRAAHGDVASGLSSDRFVWCGKSRAGTFWLHTTMDNDRRGRFPKPIYDKVCRILRRRDRPTAHPRHGSMQARLEVQTARYQRTVAEVTKLPSRSLCISLLPCDTGLCDCGDHASGDTLRRSKAPDLPLIPSMLSFGRAGCSISRRYSVPDAIP